jgi:hypothetical protein
MALFPLFGRKSQPQPVGTATPTFFPLDWVNQYISGSMSADDAKYLTYYLSVPELQSVINYRAKLFASMKVKLKNTKDNKIVENHKILELLEQPNVLQDFTEFANQASVLKDIFGNNYIHKLVGVKEVKALFNLPAGEAEIVPVEGNTILFNQTDINKIIKEYLFKWEDGKIKYKPEHVIHSNDTQIRFDLSTDKYLKGSSRIQSLTQACENVITAYQARGILQGNAPVGIINNKTKDGTGAAVLDPEGKKVVQEALKKYGLSHKKYQFIVTGMELGFQSMATNVGMLKLFEEVAADQLAIANAYSFSSDIFKPDVKFTNKEEADKQMYQNATIPDTKAWLKNLSKGLGLFEENLLLIPDFTHIPVLQDDLNERAKMWVNAIKAMSTAKADGVLDDNDYKENLKKIGMIKDES